MRGLTIHSKGWPGEGLMTFGVVMGEKLEPLCVGIGWTCSNTVVDWFGKKDQAS